jgi:hypothetical protein
MGELEAGVGQSVYPLDHLGLPFNMLRAFRRLLFLDTAEVLGSPLVRELPASVVLHHLYSRAPAELQSPHVRQSFTPAQVNTTASLTLPHQTRVSVLHCNCSGSGQRFSCTPYVSSAYFCWGTSCCKQSVIFTFVFCACTARLPQQVGQREQPYMMTGMHATAPNRDLPEAQYVGL